jgi:signal transduction histidine kinase
VTRRLTWLDGLVAIGAVLAGLLDQPSLEEPAAAWQLLAVWAAVSAASVLWWRSRPVLACGGSMLALAVAELGASWAGVSLTFLTQLPLAVSLYGLGSTARPRTTLWTSAALGATILAGVVVNETTADPEHRGGVDVAAALLPLALALAAGLTVRNLRLAGDATRDRLAAERRERAAAEERATAEERARIAREMHDVVAHSVTLLVVHAEAMRARGAELPEWARAQADAMAADGRRAADEMRELLAVLRDDESGAPLTPAPRVSDVAALVESSRSAGALVEYVVTGEPVALSRQAELVAYRVVQESMTNCHRHAFGTPVSITQSWSAEGLRIAVESGLGAEALLAGGGNGLTGLRGRLVELGGSVEAGRTDDDRHRVVAFVPAVGGRS